MAKNLLKKKKEPVQESVEEVVGQDSIEQQKSDEKYMNKAEAEVLQKDADETTEEKRKVSTEKMEKAVELIQDTFNLSDKGYVVNAFTDGGVKLKLSLANSDFELSVTIRDSEKYGLL